MNTCQKLSLKKDKKCAQQKANKKIAKSTVKKM